MDQETINNVKEGIKITLPKIDLMPKILIEKGVPKVRFEDNMYYHHISMITEILLVCLTYSEEVIMYFTRYNEFPLYKVHGELIDIYNHNHRIFRENIKTRTSGSSITNNTYLYCFDLIDCNILDVFKVTKDKISVIFPTVVPTIVKDIVYLFTYIADKVSITKDADWLKDSFVMTADNINKSRLRAVYNKVKCNQQVDRLIENRTEEFNTLYSKFLLTVCTCVTDIWNQNIIYITKDSTKRNSQYWEDYDKLFLNNK